MTVSSYTAKETMQMRESLKTLSWEHYAQLSRLSQYYSKDVIGRQEGSREERDLMTETERI